MFRSGSSTRFLVIIALSCWATPAAALGWFGETLEGQLCDGEPQGFGPYDYFDVDEPTDPLYHEGRRWEADWRHTTRGLDLIHTVPLDQGSFQMGAENLDYTLRAYPNDPRALQGMIQMYFIWKQGGARLVYTAPPPECYFQRAIHFRPKQVHVRLLFGLYLHKRELFDKAIEQYETAVTLNEHSAEAHYNWGLALVELDRPKEALPHAQLAYDLGYPLPGLRRLLEGQGFHLKDTKAATARANEH